MIPAVEFIDVAFFRLIFNLLVDYLVATGYLLPEQRDQWVQGWAQLIGVAGAVVFMGIWQYHSHKKDATKVSLTLKQEKPVVAEKTLQNIADGKPVNTSAYKYTQSQKI
jgi:hypothetical protein